jgi:hypothetical protein
MRAHGIDCVLEAADAGVDGHTAGTEVGMWKNAHARPQRLTAGVSLRYFNLWFKAAAERPRSRFQFSVKKFLLLFHGLWCHPIKIGQEFKCYFDL